MDNLSENKRNKSFSEETVTGIIVSERGRKFESPGMGTGKLGSSESESSVRFLKFVS